MPSPAGHRQSRGHRQGCQSTVCRHLVDANRDQWAALSSEKIYCARGGWRTASKECQLDLFADRTSTVTMRASQLRLWFASMAYVLLCALRRIGLAYTQFAEATCGTIRLKLLKLGALVRISVRRIKLAMASAFPLPSNSASRSRSPQQTPRPEHEPDKRHTHWAARRTRRQTTAQPPLGLSSGHRRRPTRQRDQPSDRCRQTP